MWRKLWSHLHSYLNSPRMNMMPDIWITSTDWYEHDAWYMNHFNWLIWTWCLIYESLQLVDMNMMPDIWITSTGWYEHDAWYMNHFNWLIWTWCLIYESLQLVDMNMMPDIWITSSSGGNVNQLVRFPYFWTHTERVARKYNWLIWTWCLIYESLQVREEMLINLWDFLTSEPTQRE